MAGSGTAGVNDLVFPRGRTGASVLAADGRDSGLAAGRRLRLALAGLWLADAALQFQPFMFTRGFGQALAATAHGNPAVLADPIMWSARLTEQYPVAFNAAFATVQLLLAAGIAWRRTTRAALAASVAWSLAVWWLGEGFGGLLAGTASPVSGAPGAVILYALLAVLLWPAGDRAGAARHVARHSRPPVAARHAAPAAPAASSFPAARAVGPRVARLAWLILWGVLAATALLPGNRGPGALAGLISHAGSGEPGWVAAMESGAASLAGSRGLALSVALAALLALTAAGIYLPPRLACAALVLAMVLAVAFWVTGEAFGAVLTGQATDPSTGPLLVLLALAYWPRGRRARLGDLDAQPGGEGDYGG